MTTWNSYRSPPSAAQGKAAPEMEEELFKKLLESIRAAGAILRGEQEPARHTHLNEADGELHADFKAQDIK